MKKIDFRKIKAAGEQAKVHCFGEHCSDGSSRRFDIANCVSVIGFTVLFLLPILARGQGGRPPVDKLSLQNDVTITSPSDKQPLRYDNASSKFINSFSLGPLLLYDGTGNGSADFGNRTLTDAAGNVAIQWGSAIKLPGGILDGSGNKTFEPSNRKLYKNDGTTVLMDYSGNYVKIPALSNTDAAAFLQADSAGNLLNVTVPNAGIIAATNNLLIGDGAGNALDAATNGLTLAPAGSPTFSFQFNGDFPTAFTVANTDGIHAGSQAGVTITADGTLSLGNLGGSNTGSGILAAGDSFITSSAGALAGNLIIEAPLVKFSNNSGINERVRIGNGVAVGTSTDPGAGVVNVNTGFRIGNAAPSGHVLGGDGSSYIDKTISAILDSFSSTRGSVLYRGASGWAALGPGTSGNVLTTNGSGADPAWAAGGGGGTTVDHNAYNSTTWNGDTDPTDQNSLRDYFVLFDSDGDGKVDVLDMGAGMVKTDAGGVPSIATPATDYVAPGGALGTPSSGTGTNITGLPISTGVSGLGSNVATFLGTASSANLRNALTDESGTGAAYFQGGDVGTPSAEVGTNITGLPISTGVSGLGTGVATALANNANAAAGFVTGNGTATITNKTVNDATNSIGDGNTYVHDLTAAPNQTGGWTEYWVTGSDFTCSPGGSPDCTSITDITGLALTAGARYEFEVRLTLLNAADTTGMKVAIHGGGSGSAATVHAIIQQNSSAAGSAGLGAMNQIDTAFGTAAVSYSGGEGEVFISGEFVARGSGTPTISVQIQKVTSNTATVRVGSKLKVRKART